jgi:hypothetical protein
MKLNHNQVRSNHVSPKAVALASMLAIAIGGVGAAEAGASTTGGFGAPEAGAGNPGGIEVPQPTFREAKHRGKTPLRVLTGIVAGLEKGKQARVTAEDVKIPGPIGTAEGQPIVFTVNGLTYFAYRQESQPDFHLTPGETASSMAITEGRNVPTEGAHLDKIGELVDASEHTVGYSIGGDSGGK